MHAVTITWVVGHKQTVMSMDYAHRSMKVFISWSGERSRLVATALHQWLPLVINDVDPFISSDIDAGACWQSEVAAGLEKLTLVFFVSR